MCHCYYVLGGKISVGSDKRHGIFVKCYLMTRPRMHNVNPYAIQRQIGYSTLVLKIFP